MTPFINLQILTKSVKAFDKCRSWWDIPWTSSPWGSVPTASGLSPAATTTPSRSGTPRRASSWRRSKGIHQEFHAWTSVPTGGGSSPAARKAAPAKMRQPSSFGTPEQVSCCERSRDIAARLPVFDLAPTANGSTPNRPRPFPAKHLALTASRSTPQRLRSSDMSGRCRPANALSMPPGNLRTTSEPPGRTAGWCWRTNSATAFCWSTESSINNQKSGRCSHRNLGSIRAGTKKWRKQRSRKGICARQRFIEPGSWAAVLTAQRRMIGSARPWTSCGANTKDVRTCSHRAHPRLGLPVRRPARSGPIMGWRCSSAGALPANSRWAETSWKWRWRAVSGWGNMKWPRRNTSPWLARIPVTSKANPCRLRLWVGPRPRSSAENSRSRKARPVVCQRVGNIAYRRRLSGNMPAGRHNDGLLVWRRREPAQRLRLVRGQLRRQDAHRRPEEAQPLGSLRCVRECLGVVPGRLAIRTFRRDGSRSVLRGLVSRDAGRPLGRQPERLPEDTTPRLPKGPVEQRRRLPRGLGSVGSEPKPWGPSRSLALPNPRSCQVTGLASAGRPHCTAWWCADVGTPSVPDLQRVWSLISRLGLVPLVGAVADRPPSRRWNVRSHRVIGAEGRRRVSDQERSRSDEKDHAQTW